MSKTKKTEAKTLAEIIGDNRTNRFGFNNESELVQHMSNLNKWGIKDLAHKVGVTNREDSDKTKEAILFEFRKFKGSLLSSDDLKPRVFEADKIQQILGIKADK